MLDGGTSCIEAEALSVARPQGGRAQGEALGNAVSALLRRQAEDGHWVFELESDATMPSDHVLLMHYMDRIDEGLQADIAAYLRRMQGRDGGWTLYPGGPADISATVRAYLALRLAGDPADDAHMARARATVISLGGAEAANVFTRIQLALFGIVPWDALPATPVEIMHLPARAPVSLWDVSYWSRVTMVPLAVLQALRPRARNPRAVVVDELFRSPPEAVRSWGEARGGTWKGAVFKGVDACLRLIEPRIPRSAREAAIAKALAYIDERLNGQDGLGAIYPPMAYVVMMYDALGIRDARADTAWSAVQKLMARRDGEAYCQPCLSPVWDTALAAHALAEARDAGMGVPSRTLELACDWLAERQVLDVAGDWAVRRPGVRPGGWAFQYANPHFPDVDDTAVVGMLLHRVDPVRHGGAVERAREWILGMQCGAGSWGAFEAGNDREVLNEIPFADHGALLDPPSADVTARCVSFLCQLGHPEDRPAIERALAYLRREQEPDGSWYGRWGTNYIYGTWSVLSALRVAGLGPDSPAVLKATAFLLSTQRADGGWGEDQRSYEEGCYVEAPSSMPTQTAWAVLGLVAGGRGGDGAVSRARAYLGREADPEGGWTDPGHNAVGFPRVFYLSYHGYPAYFPVLALARVEARGRKAARPVPGL